MKPSRAPLQALILISVGFCFQAALPAQETTPAASKPAVSPEDEIVVEGKAIEELRLRVERAEDDVYTRFNEINSDDSYDIHCYERAQKGSHVKKRVCLSNAARAADVAIGEATARASQGATTGDGGARAAGGGDTAYAQSQRVKQIATERRVQDELRRLAQEDPILKADVARLGDAYRALGAVAGSQPGETRSAELDAGKPSDAQHLFEVRVGDVAWSHALTSRTFTLANVQGRIREVRVDCDKTAKTLDYKADAEWTIPESWGACTLQVSAKQGTTFALYEFE